MATHATIETNKGTIELDLYPDVAPATVENFATLAGKGFYDGLTFHRYVPGFVIQGGDPEGSGMGGPGYKIKAEFNDKPHIAGTLAMARSAHPDSAGSQFYICLAPAPHLDRQYTVFGQVTSGLDVVLQLREGDKMTKVTVK
jgi:peptidylprolyl isomerase/peptidyl-prolyl cis-trans isomerase B (cyclophilin B)